VDDNLIEKYKNEMLQMYFSKAKFSNSKSRPTHTPHENQPYEPPRPDMVPKVDRPPQPGLPPKLEMPPQQQTRQSPPAAQQNSNGSPPQATQRNRNQGMSPTPPVPQKPRNSVMPQRPLPPKEPKNSKISPNAVVTREPEVLEMPPENVTPSGMRNNKATNMPLPAKTGGNFGVSRIPARRGFENRQPIMAPIQRVRQMPNVLQETTDSLKPLASTLPREAEITEMPQITEMPPITDMPQPEITETPSLPPIPTTPLEPRDRMVPTVPIPEVELIEDGLESKGRLIAFVTTLKNLYPVENAKVTIFTGSVENMDIIETKYTDQSGKTEPFILDAPPKSLSLDPQNRTKPYALYNMMIQADGYVDNIHINIPVYDSATSVERTELIFLDAAGSDMGPRIIDESMNYSL
jgi:hypothetical protein